MAPGSGYPSTAAISWQLGVTGAPDEWRLGCMLPQLRAGVCWMLPHKGVCISVLSLLNIKILSRCALVLPGFNRHD